MDRSSASYEEFSHFIDVFVFTSFEPIFLKINQIDLHVRDISVVHFLQNNTKLPYHDYKHKQCT